MYETITLERRGAVALLTINRPDKLNALSRQVHQEGVAALDELKYDDSVRVVVLTGSGEKAFIAGADIKEFQEQTPITQRNEFHQQVVHRTTLFGGIRLSHRAHMPVANPIQRPFHALNRTPAVALPRRRYQATRQPSAGHSGGTRGTPLHGRVQREAGAGAR